MSSQEQGLELRRLLFELSLRCKEDISNNLQPIAIERRFHIKETGRYYFLGGKSMNINVNQDVKISTGLRVARSFGFRPLRAINGVLESGKMFITSKILSLFVGSFDFSYNMQRDKSYNEGTGITNGTYLVMQNADVDVEITRFEQCLSVRWDPRFAEKYHTQGIDFLNSYFSEDLVSALYLCSGEIEDTPIGVRENYYYFTQHFTEGDMLDSSDVHNHPWLLALRGVREFRAFMLAIQSYKQEGDKKNSSRLYKGR